MGAENIKKWLIRQMRNKAYLVYMGIIVFSIIMLIVQFNSSEKVFEEFRKEDELKLDLFKKQFDYNIDSLLSTVDLSNSESIPDRIKGKCLIVNQSQDGLLNINLKFVQPNYGLPDELIAYKLKELNTIVICRFDKPRVGNVIQEQVDLFFYDVQSKKIQYNTRITGDGSYIDQKRGTSHVKTFLLGNKKIIEEILSIVK